MWWSTKKFNAGSYSAVRSLPKPPSTVCFVEWFAIITCTVCIYVFGDFSLTIEILSNIETKLCLVLHIDHKPLNIKTTQWNRLSNVNAKVLFMQKNRTSIVYLRLFTGFPSPILRRRSHVAATGWSGQWGVCVIANFLIFLF